jgi:valyl-tRNA synthetase
VLDVAAAVLGEVRKAKSEARQSMRAEVRLAVVSDTPERLAALRLVAADVTEAGRIAELATEEAADLAVKVELAEG